MNATISTTTCGSPKTLFDGRDGWELLPGDLAGAPPAEFLEAMQYYAGLESTYRKRLQGIDGNHCELHILEDSLTWQLDFPELGRGVVYRIDATAGKSLEGTNVKGPGPIKLRGLVPTASYQLNLNVGPIQMRPTDSSVGNFTSGPLFPMVHDVEPLKTSSIPESATGRDLIENGFMIPIDGPRAYWIAYQRVP